MDCCLCASEQIFGYFIALFMHFLYCNSTDFNMLHTADQLHVLRKVQVITCTPACGVYAHIWHKSLHNKKFRTYEKFTTKAHENVWKYLTSILNFPLWLFNFFCLCSWFLHEFYGYTRFPLRKSCQLKHS